MIRGVFQIHGVLLSEGLKKALQMNSFAAYIILLLFATPSSHTQQIRTHIVSKHFGFRFSCGVLFVRIVFVPL